jgi:maltooligosyltrehalose trehalohydrolase
MIPFEVWAPDADAVEADVDGRRHPMARTDHGWWRVEVDDAHTGSDYGFSFDGGDVLADPRSPWQPEGVHGLSRVVDHGAFDWQTTTWRGRTVLGAIVYELHIGTFTDGGTFDAAIERLDHLVDVGIDVVEILPVAAFPGQHGWGYDGVFLYAVHEPYGGPDGLRRFVDACHRRGLAVVLDVVYNHFGPDGNVVEAYGPYFTDTYATPWGQAINYGGAGSAAVRRFVVDNALMWLRDYRIDGLRLDAVHAILDTSAVHLLEQVGDDVAALAAEIGRPLTIIAESDLNDPRLIASPDAGGYGLDAQWSDDFHHALHSVVTGETFGYYEDFGTIDDLARALTYGYVYAGRFSKHRQRRHGRPLPATISGHRLFGYSQDHDQIGNRAAGERLAALVSPGLVKIAAAIVLTSPFTPMLFMGEEWSASTPWQYFTDHEDPKLADAVRNGRREEFKAFGWAPEDVPDPQDPQTVRNSTLRWAELAEPEHAEIIAWYRNLIALRRKNSELLDGDLREMETRFDETERWLVVGRDHLRVVANFSSVQRQISVSVLEILLESGGVTRTDTGLSLPPESVAVVRGTKS